MDQLANCCRDFKQVASCKDGVDECVCPVCHRRWEERCFLDDARPVRATARVDLLDVDRAIGGYTVTDDDGGKRHIWTIEGLTFVIRTKGERDNYVGSDVVAIPSRFVRLMGEVS